MRPEIGIMHAHVHARRVNALHDCMASPVITNTCLATTTGCLPLASRCQPKFMVIWADADPGSDAHRTPRAAQLWPGNRILGSACLWWCWLSHAAVMCRSMNAACVQVRPKHTVTTLRYSFRVQSIRSVDPALPLLRGGGGQMQHALEVPPARVLCTDEAAAARREAARTVRMLRRSSCM